MKFIIDKYLKPVEIDSFFFTKLEFLNKNQLRELAEIYTTLFNADNINVIKELGLQGRTVTEGLWVEDPHTVENSIETLEYYLSNHCLSAVLMGIKDSNEIVIGALIIEKKDMDNLVSRGYQLSLELPKNVEFWCEVETFKREITLKGEKIRNVSKLMRDEVIKNYKNKNPILIYSSSNNPYMVKSWKNDNFIVVQKMTTFGNKFQSFKLIL